jgi:hypothetical protein
MLALSTGMAARPAAFDELSQGADKRMYSKSRMLRPSWPWAFKPMPRRKMHAADIFDSSLILEN